MKNVMIIIAASAFSILSFASTSELSNVKFAEYELNDCEVNVWKGYQPNQVVVEVRKQGSYQYGKVVINEDTKEIQSIYTCNDLDTDNDPISSKSSQANGKTVLSGKCGGVFMGHKANVKVTFDDESGLLQSFSSKYQVSYSLPKYHTGPIKETVYDISCN
jgi:hypothetical protein